MAELQRNIVFHGRHFVRHIGICNPICAKLLQVMFGVLSRNLKKNEVSISNRFPGIHKRGIHTHRQTDTHTHTTIAQGEMQCVAFRLKATCGPLSLGRSENPKPASFQIPRGVTKILDGQMLRWRVWSVLCRYEMASVIYVHHEQCLYTC